LIHRFVVDTADEPDCATVAEPAIEAVAVPTLAHLGAPAEPFRAAVLGVTRRRPAMAFVGRS
jgi:hypothetical protein